MIWKRDWGLTGRVWLTMFLLFVVYLGFITVLSVLGIGFEFIIVIAIVLVVFQYYFSDRLVLWTTRSRVVAEDEFPDLHRMVEKLAAEAGIPKPRVAIMQSPVPNAFATGRSPRHAVVACTDSILRLLSKNELEAVLAHELAHVKNRDILTMTLASFVAMLASIIMQNFLWGAMFGGNNRQGGAGAWIIAGIVAAVVWFVATLLLSALSRYREFAADRGSGYITRNPRALISALTKISGRMDAIPAPYKAQVEGANMFFIIPALSGNTLMALLATHPPLEKRIENLERVQAELHGY